MADAMFLFARNARSGWSWGLLGWLMVVVLCVGVAPASGVTSAAQIANNRFLVRAFEDFLGRAPTQGEVDLYGGGLTNGNLTRARFLTDLAESPEWTRAIVQKMYLDTLGRPGEASGVAFWAGEIQSRRLSVARVAARFYASQEYFAGLGGGTVPTWIDDLYRKLLLREPDDAGRAFWVDRANTRGRTDVALAMFQSGESARTRVTALYQQLLGRGTDAAGLQFWAARVIRDGDISLAVNLAASQEYVNRAQNGWPAAPTVTTASLPQARSGEPYNVLLNATGGTTPRRWSATGLPAGLSINPTTGRITGTPSGARTVNVTIRVEDLTGAGSQVVRQLVVAPAAAIDVVTEGETTCAIISGGAVYCWGSNSNGQLGIGSLSPNTSPSPRRLPGITGATQIDGWALGFCAVVAGGQVRCWGNFPGAGTSPVTVPGLSGVVQLEISHGHDHACARLSNGTVRCWGAGSSGQHGNGSTATLTTPVAVSGLTGATDISHGGNFVCAIVAGGQVRCWGSGSDGTMGDGGFQNRTTPVTVSGLSGVVELATGFTTACARLGNGGVRCWGRNNLGQVGNGDQLGRNVGVPAVVSGVSGATRIVTTIGFTFCALVTGGEGRCWGGGFDGELGGGFTTVGTPFATTVSGLSGATDLAAGSAMVCAVVAGGAVRCWGDNDFGGLGNGTKVSSSVPVPVTGLTGVSTLVISKSANISRSGTRPCATTGDGRLRCWGNNIAGGVGDGTTTDATTPRLVPL